MPDLPPLVEIGEVTDDYAIGVTVDPHEAGTKFLYYLPLLLLT